MGLDPDEWRILREMGRGLESEDPDLASLLSIKPRAQDPPPPGQSPPPPDIRTWVRSFTMAVVVIGLLLIGRVASTTPSSTEVDHPAPSTSTTPAPHDRVGLSRWAAP